MERGTKIERCNNTFGDQDEEVDWEDFVAVKGNLLLTYFLQEVIL